MEAHHRFLFMHRPAGRLIGSICAIGLLLLFSTSYERFDDWRFRRGMQFTPLSCEALPAGTTGYGIMAATGKDASPRVYTVLAIANTARHPDHYDADCRPRLLPGQDRPAPALTLGFDGRHVRGLPAPLPRLMPDAAPADPAHLLVVIRRARKDEIQPALVCDGAAGCRLVRPLMPGGAGCNPLAGLALDIRLHARWQAEAAMIGDQLAGLVEGIASNAWRTKPPSQGQRASSTWREKRACGL